ncbi:MAG: MFS transporter [Pseudonocardia sp.]|nr:MFS transporter [Pseudonocardia sp.]
MITANRTDTGTADTEAPEANRPEAAARRGWAVPLSVLIVGSFMSVLDTSIVNVAIPKIQVDLSASSDDVAWVVTGYTLALGVIIPLSGWLGLRVGQTRLYVMSMIGFAIGSGLCGLAWNLDSLIVPRVRPTRWPRFDLWGFLTIAYGLFALLLAFSEGQKWGWTGYRILALFVSGALSLALFVIIELEVDNPIINLRILACYSYSASFVLLSVVMTGLFTALYFLPQFLQQVQGMQELNSGLVLAPAAGTTWVKEAQARGAPGLLGMYNQLTNSVTTETYDNGFYITALLCATATILALTLRSGKSRGAGERVAVEM